MKEKFVGIWDNIKEFVEDHTEGIIYTMYGAFMVGIFVISCRSIMLFNQKTKLEIEKLSK